MRGTRPSAGVAVTSSPSTLIAPTGTDSRPASALVIVLTAAYMTFLPAAAQFPQDRYRVPVDGLLFMLAVWGAAQLIQHLFAVRPPSASSADQPAG